MRGLRTKKNKKRNLRGGASSAKKKWTKEKTKCFFTMFHKFYKNILNTTDYRGYMSSLNKDTNVDSVKQYLEGKNNRSTAKYTMLFIEPYLIDWEIIESFSWYNEKTGEEVRFSNSDLENFIKHRDKAMDLFNEAYRFLQNKVDEKICSSKRHSPRARSAKVGQVAKTSMRLAGKEIIKSFRNLFGIGKR